MDITTELRETGTYAISKTGMQQWPAGGQTWQAPGVRVQLMAGRKALATITVEAAATAAEDTAQRLADEIEPWVQTLRYLDVVAGLRDQLAAAEALALRAEDDEQWGTLQEETREEILSVAQQSDVDGGAGIGSGTCRRIVSRLTRQIAQGQRLALAHAPDVSTARIHPAWTLPSTVLVSEGDGLAQAVAGELLAGWASARDQRETLLTWAVQEAGVTRSEVQRITSVSRSTINRLLPDA